MNLYSYTPLTHDVLAENFPFEGETGRYVLFPANDRFPAFLYYPEDNRLEVRAEGETTIHLLSFEIATWGHLTTLCDLLFKLETPLSGR